MHNFAMVWFFHEYLVMQSNFRNTKINWKRFTAAFMLFLFLFSSLGFTVHFHYCPTKGSSTSLSAEKNCCCTSLPAEIDNCCSNESEQLKITDDFQLSHLHEFKSLDLAPDFLQSLTISNLLFFPPVQVRTILYSDVSPPEISVLPIFIFDRSILV